MFRAVRAVVHVSYGAKRPTGPGTGVDSPVGKWLVPWA